MACAIKKWDEGCLGESSISKVLAIETGEPPYNVHIKMKTDKEKKTGCGGVPLEAQC